MTAEDSETECLASVDAEMIQYPPTDIIGRPLNAILEAASVLAEMLDDEGKFPEVIDLTLLSPIFVFHAASNDLLKIVGDWLEGQCDCPRCTPSDVMYG